jgi:hypothetical protein
MSHPSYRSVAPIVSVSGLAMIPNDGFTTCRCAGGDHRNPERGDISARIIRWTMRACA